ncbi:radical SAM protein, partial [candidate division KSB1 bacterium]|nr:radical SAM protein [candidate division KSB1 bacterium]
MINHILLVNPWIYDFAAYDLWSKPLGLLYLASLLRLNGVNISWVDCLDPDHPDMHDVPHIRMPKRKSSGAGSFASKQIPKPNQLRSIPRNFHRYGISDHVFQNTLMSIVKPDAIMVTSMMTYWYQGVFDTISLLKMNY